MEETENWKNIKLYYEIIPEEIKKLKGQADITILGSGSIIQKFANLEMIDEYFLVVVPVILGEGKSFFNDVKKTGLNLLDSKKFNNKIVLLHYNC